VALRERELIHFLERETAIETINAAAEKGADRSAPGEADQSAGPAGPVTREKHADQRRHQPAVSIRACAKQGERRQREACKQAEDHTEDDRVDAQRRLQQLPVGHAVGGDEIVRGRSALHRGSTNQSMEYEARLARMRMTAISNPWARFHAPASANPISPPTTPAYTAPIPAPTA